MEILEKASQRVAKLTIIDDRIQVIEVREGAFVGVALNDKQSSDLTGIVFYDSRHAREFGLMCERIAKIMESRN